MHGASTPRSGEDWLTRSLSFDSGGYCVSVSPAEEDARVMLGHNDELAPNALVHPIDQGQVGEPYFSRLRDVTVLGVRGGVTDSSSSTNP